MNRIKSKSSRIITIMIVLSTYFSIIVLQACFFLIFIYPAYALHLFELYCCSFTVCRCGLQFGRIAVFLQKQAWRKRWFTTGLYILQTDLFLNTVSTKVFILNHRLLLPIICLFLLHWLLLLTFLRFGHLFNLASVVLVSVHWNFCIHLSIKDKVC